ncbi:MAG: four helix bundle suffix domain-containing protein [Candidatus Daviesbacteria bacterium]|nr:four helix bundle suffix domain-containing protein [Candidatus Daviesbacteria bacterium]
MLPRHKYLLTYRYSEIIHDLTVIFVKEYILGSLSNLGNRPDYRSADQMVQAARSGKQNIVEGVGQSLTSKKGEIKLLGVAKASLEELLTDFEDFLRQRNLAIWPKTDNRISAFRQTAFRLSYLSNLSNLGDLIEKPKLPENPEEAANFLLTLCHQATFLLHKQIIVMEEKFIREGGFTENLFKKRLEVKINNK